MAKKKREERPTPKSVLEDLNKTLQVYGMDFELLDKTRPRVAYIRVTTRMNRPAPNAVIGHLQRDRDWRPLQRHEYKYRVYRYYKMGVILVVIFPSLQEYDIRGNTPAHAKLSTDRESHERFFGVINRSGQKS